MKKVDCLDAHNRAKALGDRLVKPATDSVTQNELWDVFEPDQIQAHLDEIDKELDELEESLRASIIPDAAPSPDPALCDRHPNDPLCELDRFTARDNHSLVSRRLRHFKDVQQQRVALYDYQQRRIIKQRMEGLFGKQGYAAIEQTILFLILCVLAALVIEYAFFDHCFSPGRSGNVGTCTASPILTWLSLQHIAMLDLFACLIFLSEYGLRWALSADRRWYFSHHKVDLISSLPFTGLLVLGGFSFVPDLIFLRVVRLLRIFRAIRIASFIWRGMERLEQVANVKMVRKSLVFMMVTILLGTTMIMATEGQRVHDVSVADTSESGGKENTAYATEPEKSLWWTITTMTSAGFGDLYTPKTPAGWVVTTLLVITGIIVVGIFTSALTSIFRGDDTQKLLHALELLEPMELQLSTLTMQLGETRQTVEDLRTQMGILQTDRACYTAQAQEDKKTTEG